MPKSTKTTKIYSYEWLSHFFLAKVVHEPDPQAIIYMQLNCTNNLRQLTQRTPHRVAWYLLLKTWTAVPTLSLWPSFPANSLSRTNHVA